jgi:hypothetical protein
VNVLAECTLPEKILLAAHQLEEAGQSPFSAEALIVSVWQKYPQTFGLKGYAELYPDSNKVLASIMGAKGLAQRGWLVKMGQKLYTLSRDGRQVVRRLLQGDEPAPTKSSSGGGVLHVPKDQDKLLNTLFGTTALEKFLEGRKQEWTFADACRFWNITENLAAEVLDARLDHLTAVLADLERQLGTSTSVVLSNGRSVSPEDVAQLYEVHSQLSTRFSRHLTLLRNRATRE